MLRRITLTKDVLGLARGDTSLTDPFVTEEAEEERYQLVANSTSLQLKRYIALLSLVEVRAAGLDEKAALRLGPTRFFAGVEFELAALCIPGIKQP